MANSANQKAWVISVNMGYGHQRTAYPLQELAEGEVINANIYEGIPKKDRRLWEGTRRFYEFISNFKRMPFFGDIAFSAMDTFQRILSFYPKRDLSKPNPQVWQIFSLIKKGWGRDLIERLKIKNEKFTPYRKEVSGAGLKSSLSIVATFFTPAFMAEFWNYPGEIFCVVCDADISRAWVPLNPKLSRIKYFAPTERVVARLKLYGVNPQNIFLTGYPLPKELIGTENLEILRDDLRQRLVNLDSQKKYFEKYKILINSSLGNLPEKSDHPLTLMFSVGGAGAQKEIAVKVVNNLREKIMAGEIKIILSAGTKEKVKNYFEKKLKNLGLLIGKAGGGPSSASSGVEIIFSENTGDYFRKFNLALKKTDILWTKPSELSFYSVLGIPIIIAPTIGSQEDFNKRWLLKSGFGLFQENPDYVNQWLFDWLNNGYLAEAAFQGFIEGEKLGTFKIAQAISA